MGNNQLSSFRNWVQNKVDNIDSKIVDAVTSSSEPIDLSELKQNREELIRVQLLIKQYESEQSTRELEKFFADVEESYKLRI